MLGAKRQLSQDSEDADAAVGPPIQRRRSSISQVASGRSGENDDGAVNTYNQWTQNNQHYDQSSSNAPIFNGPIYGGVHSNSQISTFDGLQFLYQHAALGAMHESDERYPPPLCHPGTRDVVVGRIIGWYLDEDGNKKIMWVHAPAGYGKTAVAGTVKEKLDVMELDFASPVGATFFFWRGSQERNSPARFVITLACQLARSIPELGPPVEAAIKSNPPLVKMALELQLIKLIVEPFNSLGCLSDIPNRLVIVDGIDECINSDRESRVEKKYAEDQEQVQIRVLDLIHRLHSHHLPLSFLILSRPEAWIKRRLGSGSFRDVVEPLDLYEVGDHVNDVKRFVRAELSRIAREYNLEGADEEWAEEGHLVWRSQGHMLYASTVLRHIDDPYGDPQQLLKDIIDHSSATNPDILLSTPFASLYELYRQIMRSCPPRNQPLMMEVLEEILTKPFLHNDPPYETALGILDRLSGRSPGSGLKALRPLHAVLHLGRGNEEVKLEQLIVHSTFREFLESPHLSLEFAADVSRANERLLSGMLDRMASITRNTIGDKLEDVAVFSLEKWCLLWVVGRSTFLRSKPTYLRMMEKVIALDLTACILQNYHMIPSAPASPIAPSLQAAFVSGNPSHFFIESMDLGDCADTLCIADRVTSHWRSSLDSAFSFMLQPTALPSFSPIAMLTMSHDFCLYLTEVISQANWREQKLVQALGNPGQEGLTLSQAIIFDLCNRTDGQDWAWDLLDHIHGLMEREQNPILKDLPFRNVHGVHFRALKTASEAI